MIAFLMVSSWETDWTSISWYSPSSAFAEEKHFNQIDRYRNLWSFPRNFPDFFFSTYTRIKNKVKNGKHDSTNMYSFISVSKT